MWRRQVEHAARTCTIGAALLAIVWLLHIAQVVDAELGTFHRKRTGVSIFIFAKASHSGLLPAIILPCYLLLLACAPCCPTLQHVTNYLSPRARAMLFTGLCMFFGFEESLKAILRVQHHVAIPRIQAYKPGEWVTDDVRRHHAWGWYALIKRPGRDPGGLMDRQVRERLGTSPRWEPPGQPLRVKLEQVKAGFTYFENLYFGGQFDLDTLGRPSVESPKPLVLVFTNETDDEMRPGRINFQGKFKDAWGPNYWNPANASGSIQWQVQQVDTKDAELTLKQASHSAMVLPGLSLVLSDELQMMAHYFHFVEAFLGVWAVLQTYARGDEVKWILFPNSQSCTDLGAGFLPDLMIHGYECQASWRGKGHVNQQILHALFPGARVLSEVDLVHMSSRSLVRLERSCVADRGGAHYHARAAAWNKMLGGIFPEAKSFMPQLVARLVQGFGFRQDVLGKKAPERVRVTLVDRGETDRRRLHENVKVALALALSRARVPAPGDNTGGRLRNGLPPVGDILFNARRVMFQSLAFVEQLRIASFSDVMIGCHGNGLTHALWMQRDSLLVEIFYEGVGADYQLMGHIAGHRHSAWERRRGYVGRHDMEACENSYYAPCGSNLGVIESLDVDGLVLHVTEAVVREKWPSSLQERCPVPTLCVGYS